jgi:hypothetical protein
LDRPSREVQLLGQDHDGNAGIVVERSEDSAVGCVEFLQNDHFLSDFCFWSSQIDQENDFLLHLLYAPW